MSKPKLAALIDQLGEEEFRQLPGAENFIVHCDSSLDPVWVQEQLQSADAFWSNLRLPITRAMLDAGVNVKVVATCSTGTDHLDLEALAERNIDVLSLKNDIALLREITPTAELAMTLMLACARRLPECLEATGKGEWPRHLLTGNVLAGKTLGIIGLGRLGTIMSEYGQAFRMRVLGTDPNPAASPVGVEKVSLAHLLAHSDVVTLHVHLNAETRRMIGPAEFRLMKEGMTFINTSRGGLVDEDALIEAMKNGIVRAAGLDVIDGEWMPDKNRHPLIAYRRENPRLIITPHVGGACIESIRRTSAHMMQKLAAWFEC